MLVHLQVMNVHWQTLPVSLRGSWRKNGYASPVISATWHKVISDYNGVSDWTVCHIGANFAMIYWSTMITYLSKINHCLFIIMHIIIIFQVGTDEIEYILTKMNIDFLENECYYWGENYLKSILSPLERITEKKYFSLFPYCRYHLIHRRAVCSTT